MKEIPLLRGTHILRKFKDLNSKTEQVRINYLCILVNQNSLGD